MMPSSRKGDRGRKPARRPGPIPSELAHKLAGNRPAGQPLLLRADGRAFSRPARTTMRSCMRGLPKRAGITGTIYALRHSSIVRALLASVPNRVVAAAHDTGVGSIEKTYSAFITFAGSVTRKALLDIASPAVTDGGR
jgi:hypothetical protein